MRIFIAFLGLLALAAPACAPVLPLEYEPGYAAIADRDWRSGALLRLDQTTVFAGRGAPMAMRCVLELDFDHRKARLVAVSDMGLTLFDVAVTGTGQKVNRMFPPLAQLPGLARMLGDSIRRSYLYRPGEGGGKWSCRGDECVLAQSFAGRSRKMVFNRSGGTVGRIVSRGRSGDWSVAFADYFQAGDRLVPGRVEYVDQGNKISVKAVTNSVKVMP